MGKKLPTAGRFVCAMLFSNRRILLLNDDQKSRREKEKSRSSQLPDMRVVMLVECLKGSFRRSVHLPHFF